MPQIHLHAEPGDYAPLVLIPGDPNRATTIASRFDGGLEAARLVNDNRLLLGYTGTVNGRPVSVQTSGMGGPSIGVVTAVQAVHLSRIGTLDAIEQAKGELLEALPASGTAVLNADDPIVSRMDDRTSARAIRYGFADLNLARSRDRIRLGNRVQGAIERMCDIDLGRDGLRDHGYYQCSNAAWFRAVPQISYAANRALMGYRGRTSVATAILVIGR